MPAPSRLNICLAQLNFTVGDIAGNVQKILGAYREAAAEKADLIVFPEMCITGYPPEDLVLRPSFQEEAIKAVKHLADETRTHATSMLVGGLWRDGSDLTNTAFLMQGGEVIHSQAKFSLPNFGVFDEKRVFTPGPLPRVADWRGLKLGIMICEDMWHSDLPAHLTEQGAQILIVINASPYEMGKAHKRHDLAAASALLTSSPLIYVNVVGGQDELVFDGRSFALSSTGELMARLPAFDEAVITTRWRSDGGNWICEPNTVSPLLSDHEAIYRALLLGLADYVEKNKFPGVVLGISGGIDSGLTAAIAVDALGPDRVRGVMMPSPYTSQESINDATNCVKKLGISLDVIPITPAMQTYDAMLKDIFAGQAKDVTEENIQARIRANLLMAISNKFGLMLLTTGNKSEMSVGYATLYGDMCGGYSVLKDVYKTTVYGLAKWRNGNHPAGLMGPRGKVIPEHMISRAPSAELSPGQRDEDSLPPYAILDGILLRLIEQGLSVDDIVRDGFDRDTVVNVLRMVARAEYKRRQAAPGVKVTGMSFGRDWRYPMTNRFKN